jgi:hypothetical protein
MGGSNGEVGFWQITGGDESDARCNLKQSSTTDDDQARFASFLYSGDLPLGDAEQRIGVVFRGSVGAHDNIRSGDDGGNCVYAAQVVFDSGYGRGEFRGITGNCRDLMSATGEFLQDMLA